MKKNNIILIGMMGAGKSSIGKMLTKNLSGYSFIDTDDEIEREAGVTIPEIFSKYSEDYFRKLESETIRRVCKKSNQIISTGGGVFQSEENRKVLLNSGNVFYLYAPSQILYDRIKEQTARPLLMCENPLKKVEELLEIRDINYRIADDIIDTTSLDQGQVANEILRRTDETFDFS